MQVGSNGLSKPSNIRQMRRPRFGLSPSEQNIKRTRISYAMGAEVVPGERFGDILLKHHDILLWEGTTSSPFPPQTVVIRNPYFRL